MAEGNPHVEISLLARPLGWVTRQSLRRPGAFLLAAVSAAVFCVVLAATSLGFKTKRLDLLNPESRYNQRWLAYLDEFGDRDDALVVFQAARPELIPPAVDRLAAALENDPGHFESILYRRDLSRLKAKALHFASLEDLRNLDRRLSSAISGLRELQGLGQAQASLAALNQKLQQLAPGSSPEALVRQYVEILKRLPAQTGSGLANAPGSPRNIQQFAAEIEQQFKPQYLTAEEGRLGFVLLKLRTSKAEFAHGGDAIGALRKLVGEVKKQHPGTWIGITGMPVIEYDEMQATNDDMVFTSILSLVGVFALFWAGYGGFRHALLACAVLLIGMAWAFGFVVLAVGHLNILSAAFGVILIGLGIDFGIHYVASYLRLRSEGVETEAAILETALTVGPGVVTGGVTTAAAFFMAGLTEFVGIAELGIVAGGGILACLAAAVLTLPPLLLLSDRHLPTSKLPQILPLGQYVGTLTAKPRLVFTAAALIVLLVAAGLGGLWYDHNLLHLQPENLQSAAIERDLFTRLDDSVWFAVSMCDSASELQERKQKFAALPTVAKTEEIATLLPAATPEKARLIADLHDDLAEVPATLPQPGAQLQSLAEELTRGSRLLSPMAPEVGRMLSESSRRLTELLRKSATQEIGSQAQSLNLLRSISDPAPPRLADLPRELTDRYVGKNRRHLLKIYARGNIWDMERLEQFVKEVEGVDPLITGHPVQTYYASRHMLRSYLHSGIYALLAVFLLLYFDFQSVRLSLLAMLPLAVGCLLTAGIIGWLGIPLNPANMIVLPLLLGIGVDDGVHLVHEYRRLGGRFRISDSTAVAVVLTSTTTMVSFGTMILAQHRGLCSLGQVLTLGVLNCLLASLLLFPAVLAWMTRSQSEPDQSENLEQDKEGLWVVPLPEKSDSPALDPLVSAPPRVRLRRAG